MQRDFKGIWIPKDLWFDKTLNWQEKIILLEIDSLCTEEKGCYASNEYLADFCQCGITTISTCISKLIRNGYIYQESFNGKQRVLRMCLSKIERQTFKDCKTIDYNTTNIYNSNIENTNRDNKETLKESQFEQFWKEYPKKVDKKGSYRAFIRIEKLDEKFETIMNALKDQKNSLQWQKENGQYIPNPTTWIHQERWEQVLPKGNQDKIITHEYTKEDFDNMYDSLDDIEV